MRQYFFISATITAISFIGMLPVSAHAHHRSGHTGGPAHRSHQSESVRSIADVNGEQDDRHMEEIDAYNKGTAPELTTAQRTFITSLLRDTSEETLLSSDLRADIQSQIGSLPPGIQRRLSRGRKLPPGIAKKVSLPEQVNEQIDLNEDVRIIVVGSDVAVVDSTTELIIDVIRDVLL